MTGANSVRAAVLADVLDDLFHGCALAAFVEQAQQVGDWPDLERVRRQAFDLYERALSERNSARDNERCHETVTLETREVR